jgi:hypothetical protein
MRWKEANVRSATVMVCLLSVFLTGVNSRAADQPAAGKPAQRLLGYSSPREAFDAKRDAVAKRDWRTAFFSLTPASQDAAVFDLCAGFLLWIEPGGEYGPFDREGEKGRRAGEAKLRAMLKKHGIESSKVWKEYIRQYKVQHGVDLDKLAAQIEKYNREFFEAYRKNNPEGSNPPPGQTVALPYGSDTESEYSFPPIDVELLSKIILPRISDKASLYEEMTESMTPKVRDELAYDYGNLEGVTESGDKAEGWVAMTMYALEGRPGKGFVKVASPPTQLKRCFHKLNGRWYNDTEKGDSRP